MADEKLLALRQKLFELHTAGSYAQALEMLAEQGARFPKRQGDIYFWKACFFALDNQEDEAIAMLEQGLEDGYWWKPEFLMSDHDLDSLHRKPAYERLLEDCQKRYKSAQAEAQAKLHSFLPSMAAPIPYPVIIAMHGRNMDVEVTTNYWKQATDLGCLVAIPQSSQISGVNRYTWDDKNKAQNEIKNHLEDILMEPAIARDKVILGGFSQGGYHAINFALQGVGVSRGFIAVVPSINEDAIEDFQAIIEQSTECKLRGYIIVGARDPRRDNVHQLHRMLQDNGIKCELEEYAELGHEYPPDFLESLKKAIEFILE